MVAGDLVAFKLICGIGCLCKTWSLSNRMNSFHLFRVDTAQFLFVFVGTTALVAVIVSYIIFLRDVFVGGVEFVWICMLRLSLSMYSFIKSLVFSLIFHFN